jgi:hypothetical protein
MIRQVVASQCGIVFDDEALKRYGIDLMSPPVSPVQADPQEFESDTVDATQPLHDELKSDVLWWILEVLPLSDKYQDREGRWHDKWRYDLRVVHRTDLNLRC